MYPTEFCSSQSCHMSNLNESHRFLRQSTISQDQLECIPQIFAAVDYVTWSIRMYPKNFCSSGLCHMTNLYVSHRFLLQWTMSHDQFICFPQIFAAVDYVTWPIYMFPTDFCGSGLCHMTNLIVSHRFLQQWLCHMTNLNVSHRFLWQL
jgi:hypothetical protein